MTTESNIKDSLAYSHQGAMVSTIGALGPVQSFMTETAQQLGNVTRRLGATAAVFAIAAMGMMAGPDAQAQNFTQILERQQQQQRIQQAVVAGTGVVANERGLSYQQKEMAQLASLVGGAVSSDSKTANVAGAVAGLGAAMLLPNNAQQQNNNAQWGNNQNYRQPANPYSNVGYGPSSNSGYNNGQSLNPQSQAVQQAFSRYQQLAEPQFQMALQANLDGNYQARDQSIAKFGQHWNAASQMGIPLHNNPDQVAKFQMLQRMNPQAMEYGLHTRVQQQANAYGMQ